MLDTVCDWIEGHYLRATYYIMVALVLLFAAGIWLNLNPGN